MFNEILGEQSKSYVVSQWERDGNWMPESRATFCVCFWIGESQKKGALVGRISVRYTFSMFSLAKRNELKAHWPPAADCWVNKLPTYTHTHGSVWLTDCQFVRQSLTYFVDTGSHPFYASHIRTRVSSQVPHVVSLH